MISIKWKISYNMEDDDEARTENTRKKFQQLVVDNSVETTLEDDQLNMLLDNVQKAPIKASNKDGQLSDTMALDWLKRSSLWISVVFFFDHKINSTD